MTKIIIECHSPAEYAWPYVANVYLGPSINIQSAGDTEEEAIQKLKAKLQGIVKEIGEIDYDEPVSINVS